MMVRLIIKIRKLKIKIIVQIFYKCLKFHEQSKIFQQKALET